MDSFWRRSAAGRSFPALDGDLVVDVAIVGAGIAGLTAAYLLERAGHEVAVLDAGAVANGETGATTAHLTVLRDTSYATLKRDFGERGAKLAASGARAAIRTIHELARVLSIDCDFTSLPAFVYSNDPKERSALEEEAAFLRSTGEEAEVLATGAPAPFGGLHALRVQGQALFHPRKYLLGLAERIQGGRGHIFENTRVLEVKDGTPCRLQTAAGTVRARDVLVCTDSPISTRLLLHPKLAPYRTYVVAARVAEPLGFLAYDTEEPYHYVRTHPDGRGGHLLIVGGEDHRVGKEVDSNLCFERLEAWTKERFGALRFEYRWSGQVLEPVDGLPFVGRSSLARHVHVATGFSGTGMTDGTLAAMILSDELTGRFNPWRDLLTATRIKPIASAKEFIKENVEFPRRLLEDRIRPIHAPSPDEIRPGEGRLTRVGGRTVAVYRGPDGTVQALSPVCTHAGCHVHWNPAETSWDCPCHGSRFDTSGKVLHGPATRALEAVTLEEPEKEAPDEKGASAPVNSH